MFAAPLDHAHRLLAVGRYGRVLAHELGVPQDAVERCAQFVADGTDITAFGLVGRLGGLAGLLGYTLGFLQGNVRLAVGLDLAQQQMALAVGLFLCHLPAFVRQHQPPGDDAGHQHQRGKSFAEA